METNLAQALNHALEHSMKEDPSIVLMGEDIGKLGGVFRVTDSLQAKFGSRRVQDSPLGESGMIGTAIGMAMNGLRPVVEIQFDAFVYTAFSQITSMLAKMHYRSGGTLSLPVVVRIPYGGSIGAIEHHSESPEAYFAHTPGLQIVSPSNPQDAYTLMRWALKSSDPVIFLEPKSCYWDKGSLEVDLITERSLPPRRLVEGADATVIAYGPSVKTALAASEEAKAYNVALEVFDLRTISPLNMNALYDSVKKTGRCVIVHEAPASGGVGAEIAARIQEECFYYLQAPVFRVGAWTTPYPVSKLEKDYLPSVEAILHAVLKSLEM